MTERQTDQLEALKSRLNRLGAAAAEAALAMARFRADVLAAVWELGLEEVKVGWLRLAEVPMPRSMSGSVWLAAEDEVWLGRWDGTLEWGERPHIKPTHWRWALVPPPLTQEEQDEVRS